MALTGFPDDESVRALRELGVTHVVVHSELYPREDWTRVQSALAQHPALTLLHSMDDGRVFSVAP
jgi:hypothetical protein